MLFLIFILSDEDPDCCCDMLIGPSLTAEEISLTNEGLGNPPERKVSFCQSAKCEVLDRQASLRSRIRIRTKTISASTLKSLP